VIGDLDAELASCVAADLDPSGERVRGVLLDGADEDSVVSIVKFAVETFGRLNGMHVNFTNAADAYLTGGVVELPLEALDEVMRVNTPGFVICAKHATSKARDLALMRHIARRYGPKGIRANAIAPGLIWHYKFDEQWMPEGIVEQTRPRQMIKSRFGNPDDVAALSALLLSDDGSFITAQTISVDGGVTFRPDVRGWEPYGSAAIWRDQQRPCQERTFVAIRVGHQNHRPSNATIDGRTKVRTTRVSRSRPTPMVTPI
jgi:NAD(P)-dependent dehydrogenase (short-subunit alcohol dehydrogenase family)